MRNRTSRPVLVGPPAGPQVAWRGGLNRATYPQNRPTGGARESRSFSRPHGNLTHAADGPRGATLRPVAPSKWVFGRIPRRPAGGPASRGAFSGPRGNPNHSAADHRRSKSRPVAPRKWCFAESHAAWRGPLGRAPSPMRRPAFWPGRRGDFSAFPANHPRSVADLRGAKSHRVAPIKWVFRRAPDSRKGRGKSGAKNMSGEARRGEGRWRKSRALGKSGAGKVGDGKSRGQKSEGGKSATRQNKRKYP